MRQAYRSANFVIRIPASSKSFGYANYKVRAKARSGLLLRNCARNKVFLVTSDLCLAIPGMNIIKSIRTEADYRRALAWVVAIFEASPGSPEFDELDILGTLVCAYKDPHYTRFPSTPPCSTSNIKWQSVT